MNFAEAQIVNNKHIVTPRKINLQTPQYTYIIDCTRLILFVMLIFGGIDLFVVVVVVIFKTQNICFYPSVIRLPVNSMGTECSL